MSLNRNPNTGAAAPDLAHGTFTPKVWVGVVAALVTVGVWCSWLISTRFSVTNSMGTLEIAVLRFVIPALAFGGVLLRQGIWPKDQKFWPLLVILFGAGVGFFFLATAGFEFAPVRDSTALMPAMLPVYTAVLSVLIFKARFTRFQVIGFCAITLGAFVMAAVKLLAGVGSVTLGHACFLAASFSWSLYTIAFRSSGLDPVYTAAFVVFWSAVVSLALAGIALLFGAFSYAGVPPMEIAVVVIFQGLLSGVVGFISFGTAVRHLGPPRATAITALVPVLATIGSYFLLSEVPQPIEWAAILIVSVGVLFASGALRAPGSSRKIR